jgi:chemotaxis protein MotB
MDDERPAGTPEWAITFGDMMALLLTFFIMLASFSEVKEQEKYQALVESVHRQFGRNLPHGAIVPGWTQPRHAVLARIVTAGRARKYDILAGDRQQPANPPTGRPRRLAHSTRSMLGICLYFDADQAQLTEASRRELQQLLLRIAGEQGIIDIQSYASPSTASYEISWGLAYQRAKSTMDFLVLEMGMDPLRVRVSVAAGDKRLPTSTDSHASDDGPVDVFWIDEQQQDDFERAGEPAATDGLGI